MNENTVNKKNFLTQLNSMVRSYIRGIIRFLALCFILFLAYQIYSLYSANKTKNDSIVFFNNQNQEDKSKFNDAIIDLSNKKSFYGILSKLELIDKYLQDQNYEEMKNLYSDLLNNKKLDKTYKSAIAIKASYEFIDINFSNLSENYIPFINSLSLSIDDELINYKGLKLEIGYLVTILITEMNNLNYLNNTEALDLYNNIMSSEVASSSIKERVNKIHEFLTNK